MTKPYYHVTDGEWIGVPKRGYKEQCCDCGLIHRLNFRVVGGAIGLALSLGGVAGLNAWR